jgi:NADPH-dependent glutamate synthase beta subunit-like oxidoreductase/dihydroorotate dehydrogenase/Pyruvate/2-oxoacid:ferredoxin oxidoreductase delta subunit
MRHPHPGGVYESGFFLTPAQLRAEVQKCEFCREKPCKEACPCDCSPADFIKAISCAIAPDLADSADLRRAAALIMSKNPLGGVCGLVCPDKHCMAACVHRRLDGAVNIPAVQATIIQRAKERQVMPRLERAATTGKSVAVVGGGPAGLAAAAQLGLRGHSVTIFEAGPALGGMCRAIPAFRMPREVLRSDIDWLLDLGGIEVKLGSPQQDPGGLLGAGFDAVVVAVGLWQPIKLDVPGEDLALAGTSYLENADAHDLRGRNVVVVGGGATAFDCAMTAVAQAAARVEMVALETVGEMPLSSAELDALLKSPVDVAGRTRVDRIHIKDGEISGISTVKVRLRPGARRFSLDDIDIVRGTEARRDDLDTVIIAIGNRPSMAVLEQPGVFNAGDHIEGPTTVVEAAASGKNAAEAAHAFLVAADAPTPEPRAGKPVKSRVQLPGYNMRPVDLEAEFFGRRLRSPFLLSAAPPTDGLEQMRLAYEAGWAGGVMKTAFDNLPIHIPAEYMFSFGRGTYANCDNVSGHALDRVCREVEQLVRDFPDRLTVASTGGPVTGDDEADRGQWQRNTRKLESAGAMGIEYSLSCPQGGDGTEGDIVSQNAALTVKIIDWILAGGDGSVPKLFKLTGAVTSIAAIVGPIREALQRHPGKKAGVTLANTFPTLAFRPGDRRWEQGIIVGMSGGGVLPISYLTLAKAAPLGVTISGNGGPMDHRAAANFLALGARTVQFCTIVTRDGYEIIEHLEGGLSHLLAERGISSVRELIGIASPEPITDFMALPAKKKVSAADRELCLRCGNCSRCPYLAITPNGEGYPVTDPARCIGCSICALKCFAGAITMRERSAEEAAALGED